MFKNYFKTALRSLWRNRGYALINIVGLAIGITGAALLLTYVQDEKSFEDNHVNKERIMRPITVQTNTEQPRYYAGNPKVMATTLVEDLPEVEAQTYMIQYLGGQFNLRVNEERFTERDYAVTNNDHFKVFTYDFIVGNAEEVLKNPFEMVMSEERAMAFFGKTDIVGQVLESPNIGQFKIVGVYKTPPTNSHLRMQILISPSFPGNRWDTVENSWTSFGGASYLLLAEGVNKDEFKDKADAIIKERLPEQLASMIHFDYQKLDDIHFNSSNIERDLAGNKGDESYIVIFVILSVFLLLIASVNYMNLATSKAVFRAKEIGIRKVVGAAKGQLVSQFLTESFLITLLATLISIGLLDILMPSFNAITGKAYQFNWETLSEYLPLLLVLTVIVALMSGLYPAFFMTRMRATQILKGESKVKGSFKIRQALVVFQFVLGIFMIIATLVVNNQMSFIKEKNLGFDQSNLLVIDINNGAVRPVFKTMRNEMMQVTGVEGVSVTSRVPGEWKNIHEVDVEWISQNEPDSANFYVMNFDEYSLDVFDFELLEGDYFTGSDAGDSLKILINEAAAKQLGFDQPIGESIELAGRSGRSSHQIIGIVKDFHFQSLHSNIEPMIIGAWNNPASIIDYYTIKYAGDPEGIIAEMEKIHEKFDNRTVMEYHFLDQQLDLFYESESQANTIFQIGAGLSIFIACLGLLGLVSFTVQKRVKELGIRKVLGASEWRLFYLLSGSFVKQVLVAFVLASPIAFYLMNNWLQNFEYKVSIGLSVFLLAAFATIMIALITVSYRSFKAASSNPVNSLRSE